MAILIFTTDYKPLQGSGIANFTFFLAKTWDASGETIIVLAPKIPGFQDFDEKQRFKTHRFSNVLIWREIFCFFLVPFLIKKHNVKIILNMVWLPCGALCYLLNRFVKIPYCIAVYGADAVSKAPAHPSLKHRLRSRMNKLKQKVFLGTKHIFAISEYTKHLLSGYDLPDSKVKVIYPACVPFNIFHPLLDGKKLKNTFCSKNEKLILTVGRLDFYKGHDCLLKALSTIQNEIPPWHYVIVGKGAEEKKLQELTTSLDLISKVTFTRDVSDAEIPLYYAACDLFVFPSLELEDAGEMEGFGIVLVEAMACKKPVISGISGGTREVVIHEETGLLVDARDTEALATALKRMLSNDAFAQKMAENGYRRAHEMFNGEKIVKTALEEIKKYS